MKARETIFAFIDAINARDLSALGDLMSDDHKFIDAHGNEVCGRDQMLAGWRGYFEWFPDYEIEVTDVFEHEEAFALLGFAGGSFRRDPERRWRLPAAWKAVVKDERIALWQVFADTKIPFELISGA